MTKSGVFTGVLAVLLLSTPLAAGAAGPGVQIRLPERFRVLTDQYFDLRVEATGLANPAAATLTIRVNGVDVTAALPAPEVSTDNDSQPADLDKAWTFRKVSFSSGGERNVEAVVTDGALSGSDVQEVCVHDFRLHGRKNVILFIGDAMGTAYRDAARIVAQSVGNGFREGFFDELLEMDRMPVSGMVMTYAMDRVVPDSANTATAWATGSKTIDGALGCFPDNTDFRFTGSQATKQYALDNPRIETLWEYLKRLHHYKTGIVTTSDVTDATPAGQGGHSISRGLLKDIAKQYVDGPFVPGPSFDVILGGGKEQFEARTLANSGDTRNLATELQGLGYAYVTSRTQLNAVPSGTTKLLGLFRTSHMNVAYDKLGLTRPSDEPAPNFGGFTDQPFLDEMTDKAIEVLSAGRSPFILMVEGASIDKQSHPNHAAGTIWDTIELDKAIGVGRAFAEPKKGDKPRTLVMVSADHDQSMNIVGVTDSQFAPPAPLPAPPPGIPFPVQNTRSSLPYPVVGPPTPPAVGGANPGEVDGFPDYGDTNADRYPENQNRYKLAVGFRSGNHTGSSVPLTAEGPGALLFTGYYDQTDIFFKTARVLGIDTDELDRSLREVAKSQPTCKKPGKGPRKLRDWFIRKHVQSGHHDD